MTQYTPREVFEKFGVNVMFLGNHIDRSELDLKFVGYVMYPSINAKFPIYTYKGKPVELSQEGSVLAFDCEERKIHLGHPNDE